MDNKDYLIEELQSEVRYLLTLLWAAAKSNGGQLKIPFINIIRADDNAQIEKYREVSDDTLVITAK